MFVLRVTWRSPVGRYETRNLQECPGQSPALTISKVSASALDHASFSMTHGPSRYATVAKDPTVSIPTPPLLLSVGGLSTTSGATAKTSASVGLSPWLYPSFASSSASFASGDSLQSPSWIFAHVPGPSK